MERRPHYAPAIFAESRTNSDVAVYVCRCSSVLTNGFDLLTGLDPVPRVVFVTAHSEHAVRAFEVDADATVIAAPPFAAEEPPNELLIARIGTRSVANWRHCS